MPYKNYQVYILRCADGSFYTGTSSDLKRRIAEHERGVFPKNYTYTRRPVTLVWCETFPRPKDMMEAEKQIQSWSHGKKQALIDGDIETLKKLAKKKFKK